MSRTFFTNSRRHFKAASTFAVLLSAVSFILPGQFNPAQADTAQSTLPKYVTDEFGHPPATPDGPLSKELQTAAKAVFSDSLQDSGWGRDQNDALVEICLLYTSPSPRD